MRVLWLLVFAGCSAVVPLEEDMTRVQTQDMADAVDILAPGDLAESAMQPDLVIHGDIQSSAADFAQASIGDMAQAQTPDLMQPAPDLAPAVCVTATDCGGAPGFYCLDASQANWLNACGSMTSKYEADAGAVCKRLTIHIESYTLTSTQRWCGSFLPSVGQFVTFPLSAAQYEYKVMPL